MSLLENRFAPITHAMGFLEAGFSTVVTADERWRRRLEKDHAVAYRMKPISDSLPRVLDSLLPLTGPQLRYIWVSTKGNWTAYFDNFIIGSDPFPPVSYLAQNIGCRGVTISFHEPTATYSGAASFSLFGPSPTDFLNSTRSISAMQDDDNRWVWHVSGTMQPFEDESAYSRKRIRDRLTKEMIASYCGTMGIRPFDESFFGTQAKLVETIGITTSVRSESLEEARERLGIR